MIYYKFSRKHKASTILGLMGYGIVRRIPGDPCLYWFPTRKDYVKYISG